jgi:hypothetical protein
MQRLGKSKGHAALSVNSMDPRIAVLPDYGRRDCLLRYARNPFCRLSVAGMGKVGSYRSGGGGNETFGGGNRDAIRGRKPGRD